jgi:conjugal transfer pilus assembly protein TraL
MSKKRSLYIVPKTLDAQMRVLGLPIDEFAPAICLAVTFFILGKTVLSILIPIISVVLIKLLKQGQGSSWLINVCHWYLPKCVMSQFLRKTPASENREYIS